MVNEGRGLGAVKQSGFTLMELVVGMLVLAIALVMLSTMLFPQADRSAKTLQRVRSAELAHSLLNEIWGKRYDEQTNINGGSPACGSSGGLACSTVMGSEAGEGRNDFDDVDDFNGLTENDQMLDSALRYLDSYPGFKLSVTVSSANPTLNKLIAVEVTTPSGEVIAYHALRSNY